MPAPEQVPVPDLNSIIGSVAGGTRRLGGAVTDVNIADRRADTSAIIGDIYLTGGANLVNPELVNTLAGIDRSYRGQLTAADRGVSSAQAKLTQLENRLLDPKLKGTQRAKLEAQIAKTRTSLETATARQTRVRTDMRAAREGATAESPRLTDLMAERNPEARQAMERAQPFLNRMGQLGAAGEQLAGALGQGFQANQITSQNITAPRMGDFGQATATRISAGQVGAGRLGDSLMGEAMRRVDLRGALDSQATRDAIQSARQGFAARGLATGSASLGAELLNRDRYQRQRAFEDLGFAQGVQGQDLGRQFQNVGNQLEADKSNQAAAMQAELANLDARYRAAAQAGEWELAAATRNQASNLQASIANEEARRLGNQANVGMLGDAYNLQQGVNQEGLRAVGISTELASAANPYNMAMGLYRGAGTNPGAAALNTAGVLGSTYMTVANDANQFNANSRTFSNFAPMAFGNYGGQQSGMGASIGGLGGMALGAGVGALLAAPTGGMSIPMGMALGSSVGGGVGAGLGGLFGR